MKTQILDVNGDPIASSFADKNGLGGQLADWYPALRTADANILPDLNLNNARSDDLIKKHGYAKGGIELHVDNIVGHLFRLNYKPNAQVLGIHKNDLAPFVADVEAFWSEVAEDEIGCYLDAERKRTFTMMIREAVRVNVSAGENAAAIEWIPNTGSLLSTAIKMISPKRISNPNGKQDTKSLKAGVVINKHGAAVAYHVLNTFDTPLNTTMGLNGFSGKWRRVSREHPWGRTKFIHLFEPEEDGQTRGSNQLIAAMEQFVMQDKLQKTKLQNAIVNAMYAAAIESELDSESAMEFILGTDSSKEISTKMGNWLTAVNNYHKGANIKMNGVKIPSLFPGEKLNLQKPAGADNGFSDLDNSILRYLAVAMNHDVASFTRDWSKTNFSSARAGIAQQWRHTLGKRRIIASRFASMIFNAVFEEALQKRFIKLPKANYNFYERKAAWGRANWIGTGRLTVDGLKEVQESVLRLESGLSTYEKELALMGEDYREIFEQQIKEVEERKEKGLALPSYIATTRFNENNQATNKE